VNILNFAFPQELAPPKHPTMFQRKIGIRQDISSKNAWMHRLTKSRTALDDYTV